MLVNSAGVGIAGGIDELPTKQLDLQLDVNLRGLMLVTAAALPLLRESQGLIVNLASIAGTIPAPRLPVYGATKAAVIKFTHTLNKAEEEQRRPRDRVEPRLRRHADGRLEPGPAGGDDPARGLRGDRAPASEAEPIRTAPAHRHREG